MLLLQRHIHGYAVLPDVRKARVDLYPADVPDGILNLQDVILLSRRLYAAP
jgi:hypothetical protein